MIDAPGFVKHFLTNLLLTDEGAVILEATMKAGGFESLGVVVVVNPHWIPTNDTPLQTILIRKDKPRQ